MDKCWKCPFYLSSHILRCWTLIFSLVNKGAPLSNSKGLVQILTHSRCHKGRLLYYFPAQHRWGFKTCYVLISIFLLAKCSNIIIGWLIDVNKRSVNNMLVNSWSSFYKSSLEKNVLNSKILILGWLILLKD